MTLREAYAEGTGRLRRAGIEEADLDAWYLLEWVSKASREAYYLNPERTLSDGQAEAYREAVQRREKRVPLQHITGEQFFMGLCFHVNEHVLIPRQDTEILVETVLRSLRPGMRVLDLCTGSGCIAISLRKLGEQAGKVNRKSRFVGADISKEALAVARGNAGRLGADVDFAESDLFASIEEEFDCIVSNPPYIKTKEILGLQAEVRLYDPGIALDGGEDGLCFYRRIVEGSISHLREGGMLAFEIGYDQRGAVAALMEAAGYVQIEARKDLAGLDRVVVGRRSGSAGAVKKNQEEKRCLTD